MKSSFLIGSFLPGYASVFKYKRQTSNNAYPTLNPTMLGDRFLNRSKQFESKRNRYGFGLQIGLAAALLCLVVAFSIPYSPESEFVIEEVTQELVAIEEIQQTQQEVKPPPPPRPTLPIAVPDDELLEDVELDLDVSLELDEEIANLGPPPAADEEEGESEPEIFLVVEQPPKIIGGLASLNQAVKYPKVALQSGVEGSVIVQVVVNEQGLPTSPKVVRSASPLLEEAAVTAVMAQKFEPGKQRGRAVKTAITIPVKFRLKS